MTSRSTYLTGVLHLIWFSLFLYSLLIHEWYQPWTWTWTSTAAGVLTGHRPAVMVPDCYNSDYRDGEWRATNNSWYPYFVSDYQLGECDRGSTRHLALIWGAAPDIVRARLALHATAAAFSPLLNTSQDYVRPALKYVWTPNHCQLPRFPIHAPSKFCEALQGRTLLFVGDSTSHEQYLSLRYLLGEPTLNYDQYNGAVSSVCPNASIVWARNDLLSFVSKQTWTSLGQRVDLENPWIDRVTNLSIVVLNSGAHTSPPDTYRAFLTAAIRAIRAQYVGVKIIWRTTVPGHAKCGSAALQVPMTQREFATLNNDTFRSFAGDPAFSWQQIPHLNDIARQTFHEVFGRESADIPIDDPSRDGWFELDSYALNKLRPDTHKVPDCLHQCLPGPVDEYNRVLFAILAKKAK